MNKNFKGHLKTRQWRVLIIAKRIL